MALKCLENNHIISEPHFVHRIKSIVSVLYKVTLYYEKIAGFGANELNRFSFVSVTLHCGKITEFSSCGK